MYQGCGLPAIVAAGTQVGAKRKRRVGAIAVAPLGEAKSIAPPGEADGAIKRLRRTTPLAPTGNLRRVNDSLSAATINEELPDR
jgi:hypothetical protein